MKKDNKFIYHFTNMDSIDVRYITEGEMEWCRLILMINRNQNTQFIPTHDDRKIQKMFNKWFPEELI
jgi:hypothetical protein